MKPLELTRRGILGTVAVLVVAAVCIRLGFWQLDRRADRLERNRRIAEQLDAVPVPLASPPSDTALAYRRAAFSGRVDDDRAIVLAGRSRDGTPGVHVLSPVRFGGGAVLVNRGWLPARDGATVELDAYRLYGGVRVEGVLLPFPDVDLETSPDGFQVRWFRVDGQAIRDQYPYPVAPLYLRATGPPEPALVSDAEPARLDSVRDPTLAAGTPTRPIPLDPPSLDAGPHLSYAIQWFSFAAIALIGWIVLVVRHDPTTADAGGSRAPSGAPSRGPGSG